VSAGRRVVKSAPEPLPANASIRDLLTAPEAAAAFSVPLSLIKARRQMGLLANYGSKKVHLYLRSEVEAALSHPKGRPAAGRRGRPINAERIANSNLRKGIVPSVPKGSPFRVLASSCGKCGTLLTEKHPRKSEPSVRTHHECVNKWRRDRRRDSSEFRDGERARDAVRYQRDRERRDATSERSLLNLQAETLPTATRSGYQWTGPELEIATRSDLTVKEAARMLGRTYYAVRTMRALVSIDPRKTALLGLPKNGGRAASDDLV
jgi:hypothetical protein